MDESKIIIPANEFHLGITMAGAVSAGAYTGGVMDYLFEILDLWERAKNGDAPEVKEFSNLIPRHKVIIDAIGGTSAGAMATTMSAIYALEGKICPVRTNMEDNRERENIFYDSWVLLDDTDGIKTHTGDTFRKVWDTSDLDKDESIRSLLNSKVIDNICERVFQCSGDFEEQVKKLPTYISREMQMLISHCFLRGIPLEVNFETPIRKPGRKSIIPNHTTYEHYVVAQYKLNNGKRPESKGYLWLNPYDEDAAKILKLSTIATGAFPVGLLYREFTKEHLSEDYLKAMAKRIIYGKFGVDDPDPGIKLKWKNFPKDFSSFAIDGGSINNEPFREVTSLMVDKYGETSFNDFPQYGMVMIDPFPDRVQDSTYKRPMDIFNVISDTITALKEQSKVKRKEMIEDLQFNFFKGEIFPRKWKEVNGKHIPIQYPIACASVEAFGGFLDINFRKHDFFLGRNNARNFFRYFFTVPYDDKNPHPIHMNWTPEMIKAFKVPRKEVDHNGKKIGKFFLPIIPDLTMLIEEKNGLKDTRYEYTVEKMPQYNPKVLFKMEDLISKRFLRIMGLTKLKLTKPEKSRDSKANKSTIADEWLNKKYHISIIQKIGNWFSVGFINIIFLIAKRSIAKRIARKAISMILEDLDKRGLLEKVDVK